MKGLGCRVSHPLKYSFVFDLVTGSSPICSSGVYPDINKYMAIYGTTLCIRNTLM